MLSELDIKIKNLEQRIADLDEQLAQVKQVFQGWNDASVNLSLEAATAKAKNQGAGRSFLGGLFGSKYRSIARAGAAASNAAISREVASRRQEITDGKRKAREVESRLKSELKDTKVHLKSLIGHSRHNMAGEKASNASLNLLKKLKEAHALGLITDQEYQEKRTKIVQEI